METLSSGMGRPDADPLPIDVQHSAIAKWIVDRRKMPADWRKRLAVLQAKAADAAERMPEGARTRAGVGARGSDSGAAATFNLARVKRCLEAVEAEEGGGAGGGVLGVLGVGGPRREWAALVRAWEKNCLHLGEAATEIVELVDYQAPFHEKERDRARQATADADRREAEIERQMAEHEAQLARVCREHNIAGKRPREELLAGLANKLGPALAAGADAARSDAVGAAIDLYEQWVEWAHRGADEGASAANADTPVDAPDELLPALRALRAAETPPDGRERPVDLTPDYVRARGKAAGEAASGGGGAGGGSPLAALAPDGAIAPAGINWDADVSESGGNGASAGDGAPVEIDWGVGDVTPADADAPEDEGAAAVVDWGISTDSAGAGADGGGGDGGTEIDWDITVDASAESTATGAADGAAPPTIDWDIDVREGGVGAESSHGGADTGAMDMMAGMMAALDVDGGSEAGSREAPSDLVAPVWERLLHKDGRAAVVNDLLELGAFLKVRQAEMNAASTSSIMASSLHSMPDAVRDATVGSVGALAEKVCAATAALTAGDVRDLLLLHASERALGRVADAIERRRAHGARLRSTREDVRARRQQSQSSMAAHHAKLCSIATRAAELKRSVEAELCAMFAPTQVNVIGSIASVAAYGR